MMCFERLAEARSLTVVFVIIGQLQELLSKLNRSFLFDFHVCE